MTIEKLKEMLASGTITKEEFDELEAKLDLSSKEKQDNSEEKNPPENSEEDMNKRIEKLVQSAVDRTAQKWGEKYKELEKKHKKLQEEKLTTEELKTLEIEEKEKAIAEREKALLEKENRIYCIKAIKKAGLDHGGDEALELIDFIMGDNAEQIDKKVKVFKALFDKFVKAEVDNTFKSSGRNPEKGNASNTENPYKKETFNLTKQIELEQNNPELAASLMAAAGK